MSQRIALKDIARELNLDVSTVSRALRADPRVRKNTAALVRETANRLGYRPNSAARALRGGKSGRVAVLLSPPQQRFASPIFLELLSTLEQKLRSRYMTMMVFAAQRRDEERAIVEQILDDRLADALMLGRTRRGDDRVRLLLDRRMPFVTFGRTEWPDQHPWIDIDYREAGRLAVRALAGSQPDRLAIVTGPEGLLFADAYLSGAHEEASRQNLLDPQVIRVEISEQSGLQAGNALIPAGRRLAVACIQDSLAFGLYRACAAAGLIIGQDLAVVGGQNFPGSEHAAPPLSTFSTEDSRVAAMLSDLLLERVGSDSGGGWASTTVQPRLLLRKSHLFVS